MITHSISTYRTTFIPSQNYVVCGEYNYKSKPGAYVNSYTNYYISIKFKSSIVKNGLRNAKKVQITNQVIMRIFYKVQ